MTTRFFKALLCAGALCLLFTATAYANDSVDSAAPPPPSTQSAFVSALTDGTPYWEERYRFENVRQGGFANDANANTLRSILGYKTGVYQDLQVNLAVLNVAQFGDHDYNDGRDGRTQFPGVGDPADTQLFLGSLTYTGLPQTTVIGGRQKVELDNQRWVGAADWRQIAQTFDGVTVDNKSIDDFDFFYGHLFHENRSPGDHVSNGTYDLNADLMHVAYTGVKNVKLIGYSYLTNVGNVHSLSNATSGVRIEAKQPVGGDWQLTGNAEYARQVSYGNDPTGFGLNYYLIEPGAVYQNVSGKAGYEVLESDGTSAVQAPLMSVHPMNGWADQFRITPVEGLEDRYAGLAYRFQIPCEGFDESKVEGVAHSFAANHINQHYGNEYDLDFTQKIAAHYTFGVQLDDYQADALLTDVRKIMVTLQLDY